MKQFKNLDEAFHYHSTCPVCSGTMKTNYSQLLTSDGKTTIVFQLKDDSIEADYYGDDIKWYSERSTNSQYVLDFFGISIVCDGCSKYSYTLRVCADRPKEKITSIHLNSESLSVEKNDELHEIKNIYSIKRTEYVKFTKVEEHTEVLSMSGWLSRRNGSISLPLIPLDLSNPEKTIDRIKGLIVFS